MKAMKLFTPTLLASLVLLASCSKQESNEGFTPVTNTDEILAPDNFNYATSKTVNVFLTVKDFENAPLNKVRVNIYNADPNFGGEKIATGFTNQSGILEMPVEVASYVEDVFVQVNYHGFTNLKSASTAKDVMLDFGGAQPVRSFGKGGAVATQTRTQIGTSNMYYIGSFNSNGLPNYLENPGDVIDNQFISEINSALPEGQSVSVNNAAIIAESGKSEAVLVQPCDVWITFISEGASFKNTLGYYVYDSSNPPTAASQIDSIFVILPNASLSGAGGDLQAGDKVYLGQFPAGKTIGWVLIQNAWSNGAVSPNKTKFYSNNDFNYEADPSLKPHSVQLIDNGRELYLNGFEDVGRDKSNCDHDFNDLLFYVTANPFEAIDPNGVPPVSGCADTDNDGVDDCIDEYPNDPDRVCNVAFDGTLAYEDLWPYKGDFDFNDMVVDYNLTHVMNADNKVVEVKGDLILKAIGAGFRNGFGFQFNNLAGSDISTATVGHEGTVNNALESNQNLATYLAFMNANDYMRPAGGAAGSFVNTELNAAFITPDTFDVFVDFTVPQNPVNLGMPPYNAFITVNKATGALNRDKEVHLADKAPTLKMDVNLLGYGDDDSDASNGRYFKTETNQPFALHIYGGFDYPLEQTDISEAYLNFAAWAQSGGLTNTDWYLDESGNRNNNKIYQNP